MKDSLTSTKIHKNATKSLLDEQNVANESVGMPKPQHLGKDENQEQVAYPISPVLNLELYNFENVAEIEVSTEHKEPSDDEISESQEEGVDEDENINDGNQNDDSSQQSENSSENSESDQSSKEQKSEQEENANDSIGLALKNELISLNRFINDDLNILIIVVKQKLLEILFNYSIKLEEAIDQHQNSILHWVIEEGCFLGTIDALLKLYCERSVSLSLTNIFGMTPLDIAIKHKRYSVIELLMSYGVEIDIDEIQTNAVLNELQSKPLERIVQFQFNVTEPQHFGNAKSFCDSIIKNNKRALTMAVSLGGDNMLQSAIKFGFIEPDLVYLIDLYKNADLINTPSEKGKTPLMTAVEKDDLLAVNFLIHNGADVNFRMQNGICVLDRAFESKRDGVFLLLYELADEDSITDDMHARYCLLTEQLRRQPARLIQPPSKVEINQFIRNNLEMGVIENPLVPQIDNSISQAHASLWVNMHPQMLRPLAKKLVDKILRIDFSTFSNQLRECTEGFNKFLRENKISEYIVVLPHESGKSNDWVFSLALPHLIKLPAEVRLDNNVENENDNNKNLTVLFVDDASYSGSQMKEMIDEVMPKISKNASSVRIFCIIPFVTNKAVQLIQRNHDVHFGSYQIIPKAKKFFTEDERQILTKNNVNKYNDDDTRTVNWDEITLCYFQHKIPDYKSTFEVILREGRLINKADCCQQFIPFTIEPYKKSKSVSTEMLLKFLNGGYENGLPKLPKIADDNRDVASPKMDEGMSRKKAITFLKEMRDNIKKDQRSVLNNTQTNPKSSQQPLLAK